MSGPLPTSQFFETGCSFAVHAGLELIAVLLPQPLDSWDYRCAPQCLSSVLRGILLRKNECMCMKLVIIMLYYYEKLLSFRPLKGFIMIESFVHRQIRFLDMNFRHEMFFTKLSHLFTFRDTLLLVGMKHSLKFLWLKPTTYHYNYVLVVSSLLLPNWYILIF